MLISSLYFERMLLGNFKRKAYNRYVRSKAANGDTYAQAELDARKTYKQYKGDVPLDVEEKLTKSMGIDLYGRDFLDSDRVINRGGRYKQGGFTKQKVDPLVRKKKQRTVLRQKVEPLDKSTADLDNFMTPPISKVPPLGDEWDDIAKTIKVNPMPTKATTTSNVAKTVTLGKKGKIALGLGLLGTAAIGGLIAVKASQRRSKKGKTVTVKGYSRNRKRK